MDRAHKHEKVTTGLLEVCSIGLEVSRTMYNQVGFIRLVGRLKITRYTRRCAHTEQDVQVSMFVAIDKPFALMRHMNQMCYDAVLKVHEEGVVKTAAGMQGWGCYRPMGVCWIHCLKVNFC